MRRQRSAAIKTTEEAFLCFIRNERWGTCADCPRDSKNNAFPEFCVNTDRYDHLLTLDSLVEQYKKRHYIG